jgi:hypothetical protein
VRKSDLFELIRQIAELVPGETPIIVGSQAVHAVTDSLPEIVQRSIECDFLLTGGKTESRIKINKKLGVFSEFQIEHGFYADALGLATVVLPTGWRERLQPLTDDDRNEIAFYAEIHDIAVSKLIAGREKDFLFLKEAFIREFITPEVFIERLRLMEEMPQNAILAPRLKMLLKIMSSESGFSSMLHSYMRELTRRS